MMTAKPARMSLFGVGEHLIRRAVGRDDANLVWHAELFEERDGWGEDGIVARATHDDADQRARGCRRKWSRGKYGRGLHGSSEGEAETAVLAGRIHVSSF